MKIQSILKRPVPPTIKLGATVYKFEANDKGDHVCDVTDAAHIRRLIVGIPEGYRQYEKGEAIPAAPVETPAQAEVHPMVAAQQRAQEQRDAEMAKIAQAKAEADAKPIVISDGENEINLSTMELDELKALAKNSFGITVHHKWKEDTIRAKIVEATRRES